LNDLSHVLQLKPWIYLYYKTNSMKELRNVIVEIEKLTTNIETNYPELYRILDENPMTIPSKKHPHIDQNAMQEYLESLKELLRHHLETHQSKK